VTPQLALRPATRRTQAERRAKTRELLLGAAVACLVDRGFAAITTGEVASRAGLSQGALFKHYPTKAALLVASVEQLYERLRAEFAEQMAGADPGRDPIRLALELLAEIFDDPQAAAWLELQVAARTNAELRELLSPVALAHHEAILALARKLFPEATARSPRFDTCVEMILSVLQGTAVGSFEGSGSIDRAALLDGLEWMARQQLGGPAGA